MDNGWQQTVAVVSQLQHVSPDARVYSLASTASWMRPQLLICTWTLLARVPAAFVFCPRPTLCCQRTVSSLRGWSLYERLFALIFQNACWWQQRCHECHYSAALYTCSSTRCCLSLHCAKLTVDCSALGAKRLHQSHCHYANTAYYANTKLLTSGHSSNIWIWFVQLLYMLLVS